MKRDLPIVEITVIVCIICIIASVIVTEVKKRTGPTETIEGYIDYMAIEEGDDYTLIAMDNGVILGLKGKWHGVIDKDRKYKITYRKESYQIVKIEAI